MALVDENANAYSLIRIIPRLPVDQAAFSKGLGHAGPQALPAAGRITMVDRDGKSTKEYLLKLTSTRGGESEVADENSVPRRCRAGKSSAIPGGDEKPAGAAPRVAQPAPAPAGGAERGDAARMGSRLFGGRQN